MRLKPLIQPTLKITISVKSSIPIPFEHWNRKKTLKEGLKIMFR